ncbi:MAG: PEP-CTERM sorting domain-containing protein [Planctomycetales bacterium]|nr:PEP-CTERM sorting domain-containing protein [Planctomycetales bacterium]
MKKVLLVAVCMLASQNANAAVTSSTVHGSAGNSLDASISVGDALSGLIGTELPGDQGWHPANTNPAQQLPIFTDDRGGSGLDGLLNDFPPAGAPTKIVQYDLANPTDLAAIKILTGNDGKDGRVFSTTLIDVSTNNGGSFTQLGYFESDLPGTVNAGQWGSTLVTITDDGGAPLATGVTNLKFSFFAVDNTGGEYRDPFDGVNPYTGIDDTYNAPIASPLVWEIDAVAVPEPATVALAAIALGGMLALRRRRIE